MKKIFGFIILISLLIIVFLIGKNFAAKEKTASFVPQEALSGLGLAPSRSTPSLAEDVVGQKSTTSESLQSDDSNRLVIKSANLSTLVKDVREGIVNIQNLAREFGGFVVSSNISSKSKPITLPQSKTTQEETGETKDLRGYITIRVSSEKFDEALQRIREMSLKVVTESTTGQDVTEQYTDLESRLRNLEASEAQLLKIMERSGTIADVLAVQKELTRTREQIETTKGRMQYLQESVKMSLISVNLAPEEAELPIIEEKWQPLKVIKNALRDLVSFWQGLADKLIYLAIFLSPFIIIIVLIFLLRKRRKRKISESEM